MIENIKEAQSLIRLIYSLEPLCYYFNMKPNEFWNSTYKEINTFTQANLCRIIDDFRQEIKLQEAVTDKLIMADAMSNKKPKILSLLKTFKNLFPEPEEKPITPEEIKRKMRKMMKLQKNT